MNQLKAYEITVKGKLEGIPMPDLQDAIWARIEAQLDTDMPTDDGTSGPFDSPSGPLILGSSVLIFLITLLTLYFSPRNSNPMNLKSSSSDIESSGIENQNESFLNPAPGEADAGPPGNNSPNPSVTPANSTGELPVNNPPSLQNGALVNGGIDSNFQQGSGLGEINLSNDLINGQDVKSTPPVITIPKDQAQIENDKLTKPLPKDSVVTGKKPRGVKGVTDNDYRIVPKKDN